MGSTPETVRIHEITRVTPSSDSPNSANEFSLPLTFFDTYWFKFPPVRSVYLFQLTESHSTPSYFNSQILPRLKRSLSLALSHYLPIAGNMVWPSTASKPIVLYTPNDGVTLTVAQSNVPNFDTLIGNEMYKSNELHPFAPHVFLSDDKAEVTALQITLFPGQGFCIGTACYHSVFDGKIASMFMRTWAYLCKHGDIEEQASLPPELTPSFDRSFIKDPSGLDILFLNQWQSVFSEESSNTRSLNIPRPKAISDDVVRATSELTNKDIMQLREKASSILPTDGKQHQYLSSFVLTLAYTATCLVQTKGEGDRDVIIDFGVDCRARLDPPAPSTYFGNCVVNYSGSAAARSFMGEKGFGFALHMVNELAQKVKKGVLEGAEMKVTNFFAPKIPGTQLIMVAGSPKLNVYEADFEVGKLKKVEMVCIDWDETVFMAESKGGNGGVEIVLALKKHEMEKFAALFSEGLKSLE